MAQSGPDEMVCCLSAFGCRAKRTCMGVWLRPLRSLMTRSGHGASFFVALHAIDPIPNCYSQSVILALG
jgi:hypothetical protein